MKIPIEIAETILTFGELLEEDREHLVEVRGISEAGVEGHFVSGSEEALEPAFEALQSAGLVEAAMECGVLILQSGNTTWNPALVTDKILIGYHDAHGQLFHLRPHKSGLKGVEVQIYGQDCLQEGVKLVVITEGEYKARVLIQSGIPALAVPGISTYVGKHYSVLREVLQSAGVEGGTILFDNDDRVNPELSDGSPNPRYQPDRKKRYDVQLNCVKLARRLAHDGFEVRIATLPDSWRVGGTVDIDSALLNGHTVQEIEGVIADGAPWDEYLDLQTSECKEVVSTLLVEDKVVFKDGKWTARTFPYEVRFEKRPNRAKGIVQLLVNGKPLPPGEVNPNSVTGRAKWAKDVAEKGHFDQVVIEELLERIALELANGHTNLHFGNAKVDEILEVQGKNVAVTDQGYFVIPPDGGTSKQISNFTMEVVRDVLRSDGIDEKRVYECVVRFGGDVHEVEIPVKDFESTRLKEVVVAKVGHGPDAWGDMSMLRSIVNATSTPVGVNVAQQFGWDEERRFLTPSGQICPEGVEPVPRMVVELEDCGKASNLDLVELPPEDLKGVTEIIFGDLLKLGDPSAMLLLLGFTLSAVTGEYIGFLNRFGIHSWGISGTLKTVTARALQCFFGPGFGDQESLLSWTSTPLSLQKQGYYYHSALAVVDDFKESMLDVRKLMMLIQNLFDGAARGRLTSDARFAKSYPFRGFLLSTGEDPMDSSASTTARVLPLPWDAEVAKTPQVERVRLIGKNQERFSGFTRAFVKHLQTRDPENLDDIFQRLVREIAAKMPKVSNGPRIARNLALMRLSFQEGLLCAEKVGGIDSTEMMFLLSEYEQVDDEYVVGLRERLDAREPGVVFIEQLRSLLASRPTLISEERIEGTIGFQRVHKGVRQVCLLPDAAMALVRKSFWQVTQKDFPFSQEAVQADLAAKDVILRSGKGRVKTQVRFGNVRMYAWVFRADDLGLETPDLTYTGLLRPGYPPLLDATPDDDDSEDGDKE